MLFTKKVKIIIKFGTKLVDSVTFESIDTRVDGKEDGFVITGKFTNKDKNNEREE